MNSSLHQQRIVFIGAGSMAEAIIRGLVGRNMADPNRMAVMNRSNREQLEALRQRYGIVAAVEPDDKEGHIRKADLVVIAMKPKDVAEALVPLRPLLRADQLLVSVVAGLSIATLQTLLPRGMAVARTMPNTSSTIGLGMTGIAFSQQATQEQRNIAMEMFRAIGEIAVVPEEKLNIVTGISGSGPAYVYYFMEALIAAGIEGGLDPETARKLTVETVLGAASMVKSTGEAPAELRRKVTSPNGTTQAAIETFDRCGFSPAVQAAVRRCVERAGEIGEQLSAEASRAIRE